MSVATPVQLTMRPLTAGDNSAIASVIRTVSAEYGLTADKGYTVADPNLDSLYELYSQPGHAYWVVERDGKVVGGGGVAPLSCSEPDICELQKMYFLPEARGPGQGQKLGPTPQEAGADRHEICQRSGLHALLSGNDRLSERSNRAV